MRSGDLVAERFVIELEAGSGGMGTVYRCRDVETGNPVALKVLQPGADWDRFEREARVLSQLAHPGIVRYVAHGMADGSPYLAMEWLAGEDLRARLSRAPLTLPESLALVGRVATALGVAHARGVVHRDLKPENLFLEAGALERVRILDFGVALEPGLRRTMPGTAVGTIGYMSPEQARGERNVDARVDVFALGCVLFECVTRRRAFEGKHAGAILAKLLLEEPPRASELAPVTPELDDLIASMLSKDPTRRPVDGSAVEARIRQLGDLAPASRERLPETAALTGREQRLVSVVFVGQPARGDAPTMVRDEAALAIESIEAIARSFEGQAETMLGGSVVVLLRGMGAAADQAARAASCALALRKVVQGTPVALATGLADLDGRTPVGDAIDRAAGLTASAAASAVRIDDVTASLLDDRFVRSKDALGALLLARREADGLRTLLGKPTPCVGRETELAMLGAIVDQCLREPVARVVLVTAPAGAGKSRVRHELLRGLESRSDKPETWIARGDPVGAGSAFALAAQMIRRTAGVLEGEPPSVQQAKLRSRVARHVPDGDRRRVAAFLGEMIGAPFEGEADLHLTSARRDAILMGDQIRAAFADFVGAECASRPLLVVLEDLHWGDQPTVTMLDAALRIFSERPLLVLAFARPEVTEIFPDLWTARDVQSLRLAPLPRKASERLARAVLGASASEDVIGKVVEQAAGNAFYLEELIRAASEGRTDAPGSVVAMVQSRLERLEPEARRVLRAASIFGRVFWERGVAALLGEGVEPGPWLEQLEEKELIARVGETKFADEIEYTFRHTLVREGAHATLTDEDRLLGHRLAAQWLERAGEKAAIGIAEHWDQGGERARAAEAYLRAAEQALEGNDLLQAIKRAESGVRCGASGDLLGALCAVQAEAHGWLGENVDAERTATAAVALLAPGSARWAEAAGRLSVSSLRLGRNEASTTLGARILELLERGEGDRSALARAGARISTSLFLVARHDLGNALLAACERCTDESDAATIAIVHLTRAVRAFYSGRLAEYVASEEAAASTFLACGDIRMACATECNLGFALAEIGAYAEAEPILRKALTVALRLGLDLVAGIQQNLGHVLAGLKHTAEALAMQRAAESAFRAQGNRRMEGASRTYIAQLLLETGDVDGAMREARAGLDLLDSSPPLRPWALAALSRALLRSGRKTEALDAARDAMNGLESLGSLDTGEARVRLAFCRALDDAGDPMAASAMSAARAWLLHRAEQMDERRRPAFLHGIPEHDEIMKS